MVIQPENPIRVMLVQGTLWPIHLRTTCTQQYATENSRLNTDFFCLQDDLEQEEKFY